MPRHPNSYIGWFSPTERTSARSVSVWGFEALVWRAVHRQSGVFSFPDFPAPVHCRYSPDLLSPAMTGKRRHGPRRCDTEFCADGFAVGPAPRYFFSHEPACARGQGRPVREVLASPIRLALNLGFSPVELRRIQQLLRENPKTPKPQNPKTPKIQMDNFNAN